MSPKIETLLNAVNEIYPGKVMTRVSGEKQTSYILIV